MRRALSDPVALCGLLVAFAAYVVVAVARHRTFRSTGFDLGLFEQVVWHYAQLETPASSLKGVDTIFADHFSPALALLAPLHRVWPRPESLLVAQVALVVAAAVPIYAYALPRVGQGGARCLAGAYLLFGGVQEALWFDVHEVMFVPLLVALAVLAADRGRWAWSVVAALSLLLVKEDMAFLVAAFGGWYWLLGHRRLGVAVALLGLAAFPLITEVVMPRFTYWSHGDPGAGLLDPAKLRTTAYLLGAFLLVPLRSRLIVLAVPLLAARMLSDNEAHWTLENHYSLAIAPVLALAAADGARGSRRIPVAILAIAVLLIPFFPLRELVRPDAYRVPAAYAGAREALEAIPRDAAVSASNRLIPHLARRDTIVTLDRLAPVVAAAPEDASPEGLFPLTSREQVCRAAGRCSGVVVRRIRPPYPREP